MKKIRVACFVCTCLLVYLFTNSLRVQRLAQRLPDCPPNEPAEDGDGASVILEFAFASCGNRDRVGGCACSEVAIGGENAAGLNDGGLGFGGGDEGVEHGAAGQVRVEQEDDVDCPSLRAVRLGDSRAGGVADSSRD